MSTPLGGRSNLLLITLLLAISILLEQFFIAPIFPWLGNLGSIRPMIVFLDIPLELPAIDCIPVSILFALFYQIAPSAGLTREHPSVSSGARVWKALTGWWALLILLVAGGGAFYMAQGYLPRTISNGIDSFGVRADLTLPYPSGDLIHLHGSVVMLLTSAIGVFLLHRRTATPAAPVETQTVAAEALSSSRVSSTGALQMPTPSINETFAGQQQEHTRYQPPVTPTTVTAAAATAATVAAAAATATTATVAPPAPKPTTSTTRTYIQKPASQKPATVRQQTPATTPVDRQPAILTPEPPPTCRLTTPPPIAVVIPRPAPGVGKMHPCHVIGSLKPSRK